MIRGKPVEYLVSLLAHGYVVTDGQHNYIMADDGNLCVQYKNSLGETVNLIVDSDLPSLVALAEKIGHDNLWVQICMGKVR